MIRRRPGFSRLEALDERRADQHRRAAGDRRRRGCCRRCPATSLSRLGLRGRPVIASVDSGTTAAGARAGSLMERESGARSKQAQEPRLMIRFPRLLLVADAVLAGVVLGSLRGLRSRDRAAFRLVQRWASSEVEAPEARCGMRRWVDRSGPASSGSPPRKISSRRSCSRSTRSRICCDRCL